MSEKVSLPSELDELFNYSDGEGLLEPEDLEEAGFSYRQEIGELELWEKNKTQIEYNPETRAIEEYTSPSLG